MIDPIKQNPAVHGGSIKLPHIQLYAGDWLKDQISGCSFAAQGFWLRHMFIMHDSEPRGFLCYPAGDLIVLPRQNVEQVVRQNEGRLLPFAHDHLARRVGASIDEYKKLMDELFLFKVPSITKTGVIYCRKMVKDEALRIVRSKAGKRGSEGSAYIFAEARAKALAAANPDNDNDNDNDNDDIDPLIGTEPSDRKVPTLKRELSKWFKGTPAPESVWPNDEEYLMMAVIKRDGFYQELDLLRNFRVMPGSFFTTNTRTTLQGWMDGTLIQRAMNFEEQNKINLAGKRNGTVPDHSKGF